MMNFDGNTRKWVISKREKTQKLVAYCVIDELALYLIKSFIFPSHN